VKALQDWDQISSITAKGDEPAKVLEMKKRA
jgi:hypothetical protein